MMTTKTLSPHAFQEETFTASMETPQALASPIIIDGGKVVLQSQVVLAPMAGVTDIVFRGLVRKTAPQSLICTEMISSNSLVYSKRWDAHILKKTSEDNPIAYQLAAHQEEIIAAAAVTICEKHQPNTLDINMGCPVKKITGNFEGCALMRDLELASRLIKAVSSSVTVPVSVKFRLGWDDNSKNYIEFGQMAQESGAKLVTLHTRTRSQGYKPGVDWEAAGKLKAALRIPVIANGDIVTPADAKFMVDTYQVDGVMIGRGTQGEPWRIALIDHYLKTGELLPEPTLVQRLAYAWQHVQGMVAYKGESQGVREMRGQLPWYVKGFAGAPAYRAKLTQVETVAEVEALFVEILESLT
jgi:tRNA-dihydrouridine synthase B